MRIIAVILLFGLVFYLSLSLTPAQQFDREERDVRTETRLGQTVEETAADPENPDTSEEDMFMDEQDIFSRKVFQEELEPLKKSEKIVWAFKLADGHTFL